MKKNILFITADQWRGDCISALGHPHVKTPHIDSLIADSVAFDHHYASCAPCAPARASLLTGMYLQNHRVTRNGTPLDDRHTNLARELRKAGYTPKLFGYTDTSLDPRVYPKQEVCQYGYENMLPGFEEGLLLPCEYPEKWLSWLREKGYDFETAEQAFQPMFGSKTSSTDGHSGQATAYKAEHSITAYLTQHVIDYISEADGGWCVHLSYMRPHPPFTAPAPYNQMVDPESLESVSPPAKSDEEHPWLATAKGPLGDWPEPWMTELSESDSFDRVARQIRATYFGLVNKVDHYIGQLINHLKKIDEYENTLIVLTSDHGELLGDHGLFGKRGYFSESYHIPLIIREPDRATATRGYLVSSFTEAVDIMPTILNWLDHPIPRQCDGRSLLPFLHNKTPDNWRQEVHWEYDFRDVKSDHIERAMGIDMDDCQLNVIRDNDYMYVHFTNNPPLLFDLRKDPHTVRNVIDQPEYAATALAYSQKLLSWRMHNDERLLTAYVVSRDGIYHR